jgi:hypothetical protein
MELPMTQRPSQRKSIASISGRLKPEEKGSRLPIAQLIAGSVAVVFILIFVSALFSNPKPNNRQDQWSERVSRKERFCRHIQHSLSKGVAAKELEEKSQQGRLLALDVWAHLQQFKMSKEKASIARRLKLYERLKPLGKLSKGQKQRVIVELDRELTKSYIDPSKP